MLHVNFHHRSEVEGKADMWNNDVAYRGHCLDKHLQGWHKVLYGDYLKVALREWENSRVKLNIISFILFYNILFN